MSQVIRETQLEGMQLLRRGKVRDIYAAGDDHLIIVATDRLSAFDVVLPDGIPGKGAVLTQLSAFWFELLECELGDRVGHHVVSTDVADFPAEARAHADVLRDRSMLVRRTEPLAVECIARGYLTGSGLKDYRRTGAVCGVELPPDLPDAARLDPPIFTPSTKAEQGLHDENIPFSRAAEIVGAETADWLRDITLAVYDTARRHAEARGILLADTKMEFGRLPDGSLILIDEVLTPDASRFWNAADWAPGKTPESYDKQVVRNFLLTLDWDRTPPGPDLPQAIVDQAAARYEEITARLTADA